MRWHAAAVLLLVMAVATLVAAEGDGAGQPGPPLIIAPIQPEPPDIGLFPPASIQSSAPPVNLLAQPGLVNLLEPVEDSEVVEGSPLTVRWAAVPLISQIRLYYSYDSCPLAGKPRGETGKVIGDLMDSALGRASWTVPWMDASGFRLRIAGYDSGGTRIASQEIGVRYRPAELTDLPDTAIGIIKRHQRLYYYRDGRMRRMHIVSTAASGYTTPTMHPGSYDRRRGSMGRIYNKQRNAWSRRYECWMPYWMAITSSGSHGIHATSPPFYRYLGSPASHGCVRQHRADAAILYSMVNVGTPVYVF